MSRYKFDTAEAHIVLDSRGFDVFAAADRPPEERPAYRGETAELGHGVTDGTRLMMRPDSARMAGGRSGLGRRSMAPMPSMAGWVGPPGRRPVVGSH